jgi:hypothetical protein
MSDRILMAVVKPFFMPGTLSQMNPAYTWKARSVAHSTDGVSTIVD